MGWGWKNVLGLIAVAVSVWLISYMVEWSIRTGGQIHIGDAFVNWWGDVVMLHWVERYQTLVAGVFAVAGGSFVLIAALVQRDDQRREKIQEQRRRLLSDVATIRRMCVIVSYRLTADAPVSTICSLIEEIEARAYQLPDNAYDLAARISVCCSFALTSLEDVIDGPGGEHNEERIDDARRGIFLIVAYLQDHNDLFQNGVFQHRVKALDQEEADEAKDLGIKEYLPKLAETMVRFPDD